MGFNSSFTESFTLPSSKEATPVFLHPQMTHLTTSVLRRKPLLWRPQKTHYWISPRNEGIRLQIGVNFSWICGSSATKMNRHLAADCIWRGRSSWDSSLWTQPCSLSQYCEDKNFPHISHLWDFSPVCTPVWLALLGGFFPVWCFSSTCWFKLGHWWGIFCRWTHFHLFE